MAGMRINWSWTSFIICNGDWTSVVDAVNFESKPWVKMIIADVLQKIEPSLELFGDDKMILNICEADFWDYVTWMEKKTCLKVEEEYEVNEVRIAQEKDVKENVEFIEMFVKLWWKKYKERVKLSFDLPPQDLMIAKGEGILKSLFTVEEKIEIIEELTHTFIRFGELCMPKKLAESIFIRTLGQITTNRMTTQDKLNLMTNLQREAKRLAYSHGSLLFVHPKRYMLREYRNENNGDVIK